MRVAYYYGFYANGEAMDGTIHMCDACKDVGDWKDEYTDIKRIRFAGVDTTDPLACEFCGEVDSESVK